MDALIAQIINGLAVGSMYALIVTGFNVLFLVGGVIQYAFPHIVVISMYVSWLVIQTTGGSLLLAVPATIVAATLLSLLTVPLYRPLIKRGAEHQTFVMSLGIAMVLTHIMSKHVNRGLPITFPESLSAKNDAIQFGITAVSTGQLLTMIGSVVAGGLLAYLLYKTMAGRAFRAMAQSPFVAKLVGIPINQTAMLSFAVAGFLGGVTAVFLAMALGMAHPALGDLLAVKIMAAVLFAGTGNLKGGVICGLILGVVESLVTGYVQGQWANAAAFGMIMVVIMIRPTGLFGMKT